MYTFYNIMYCTILWTSLLKIRSDQVCQILQRPIVLFISVRYIYKKKTFKNFIHWLFNTILCMQLFIKKHINQKLFYMELLNGAAILIINVHIEFFLFLKREQLKWMPVRQFTDSKMASVCIQLMILHSTYNFAISQFRKYFI